MVGVAVAIGDMLLRSALRPIASNLNIVPEESEGR